MLHREFAFLRAWARTRRGRSPAPALWSRWQRGHWRAEWKCFDGCATLAGPGSTSPASPRPGRR